jgi:hypothetical protein
VKVFEFLLQHGAAFKARSLAKENAFIIAARCYHADLLEDIKEHHPEIGRGGDRFTPTIVSVLKAHRPSTGFVFSEEPDRSHELRSHKKCRLPAFL